MGVITLAHGSGGKQTQDLIKDIFYNYFDNDILLKQNDSSIIKTPEERLAVTTDSFIVNPLFFPGGDIGKLSICGTINDLAVCGAVPQYIAAGFIIEEGLEINILTKIVISMADTARQAGVKIITGDTKVVEKGKGDKIFINTTGIGYINKTQKELSADNIEEGDVVIINGTISDHGVCITALREELDFNSGIKSDCCCLNELTSNILSSSNNVKFMRDATRGGIATTLCEIAAQANKSIVLKKSCIPIKDEVRSVCKLLGFDPLYMANEGKILVVVSKEDSNKILDVIKKNPLGTDSSIIGEVIEEDKGNVYLKTEIGGTRILYPLEGEVLPRIC